MKSFTQFLRENALPAGTSVFYHGTSSTVKDGIIANGLVHHAADQTTPDEDTTGERSNSVYLTKNIMLAHVYAQMAVDKLGGSPLVLRVCIPFEFLHNVVEDEADADGVRFRGTIPVEWIS